MGFFLSLIKEDVNILKTLPNISTLKLVSFLEKYKNFVSP